MGRRSRQTSARRAGDAPSSDIRRSGAISAVFLPHRLSPVPSPIDSVRRKAIVGRAPPARPPLLAAASAAH